ncbi:MAG: electron transfer flavoprotein subunit beta/FixA family protein [Spirochaetaceae bacterium]|jgi:electron transfer flavoprotein beta subunit|nr:electron transfer flavoprotein subunit beta/FixA family protein [Spirochaetaceae bacterium]
MNIIVCIKQVPDTNEVKLDPVKHTLIRDGVSAIINPDDKAGIECALQLKDKLGAHITVVTMGLPAADVALREALAMGCDDAVLVTDRRLGGADTWATSATVASAVKAVCPNFDLIITGRQAIDGDTAQVGPEIAEHLKLPVISYASDIKVDGGNVTCTRSYDDRTHKLKVKMPCLLTAIGEATTPRYMTPGGIFDAYNKEIKILGRDQLDVAEENIGLKGSPTNVVKSWPKDMKGAGVKKTLDPKEGSAWLVDSMVEKHIL